MIMQYDFTAARQSVPAEQTNISSTESGAEKERSRRRRLWCLAVAAVVGACALGLMGSVGARGEVSPLQILPLAQGYSTQHNINLHAKGPSDVLQSLLVFQPGGDTGWHSHPGPVVVVVKSGAITEYRCDGGVIVHPAGSVFFETKGEVHRAVNQTGGVAEVYATFISPAGTQPLIPAPDPRGVCQD
jgi:quercetin dioxygenase-like cupin family protein